MNEKVGDVMTTMPIRVDPETSVGEVAALMREQDIGDVLVMEGERLLGIVTDRDIVVRVLADQQGPATAVRAACTLDVVVVGRGDSIDKAVRLMRENKLRRLPVVADERVVGVVTLGDLAQVREPESALGQISAADPTL
jgi:CBS domain-containing protein